MADLPQQFEEEEVKVLRGLESKKIAEFESNGWEFVSEDKGKLRTTLKFRRPKKPIPKKIILAGVGVVVILASVITVGAATEDKTPSNTKSDTQVTQEAEQEPVNEEAEEVAETALTVENSPDLARLLSDKSDDHEFWQTFYDKYRGKLLEFDANVALMEPYGKLKYTYAVLFYPGDYDENTAYGPPMRDQRLVIPFDWHQTNPDDFVTDKTNIRLAARITDYSSTGNVFDIEIVSTTVR